MPKILVIDDEKNIRDGIKKSLEYEGYEVVTADNGEKGIETVYKGGIDLVITDLKMPEKTGEEFLKEILEFDKHIPVIVLTGHGNVETAVDMMRLGAYDFMTKPFNLDKMLLIIARALESKNIKKTNETLESRVDYHESFYGMIGHSPKMLKVYEDFQRNILALPVIVGRKTDKEKFAGAEETYTLEAMMYDGVALQNGTSHYFGDHFAKAFDIKYLDEDNTLKTPYQTSWGVSTRMIGAIIMTHGDNHGLVLPPKIAPIKLIFIPITNDQKVLKTIDDIAAALPNDITYKIDLSDKSPGYKFAEAEVKGIPIRLEVGPRDLENNEVTIVRRDTLEKKNIKVDEVKDVIPTLLETIQNDMYNRALKRRDEHIYDVKDYAEFLKLTQEKTGFVKINWCGDVCCEEKIKNDTNYKSRCTIDDEKPTGPCLVCGKKATKRIYVGKQY